MATIPEATAAAIQFAVSTLGKDRTQGLRLEEVESGLVDGEEVWLVTLSMTEVATVFEQYAAEAFPGARTREYKVFSVRKKDGEVLSMKIRQIAAA